MSDKQPLRTDHDQIHGGKEGFLASIPPFGAAFTLLFAALLVRVVVKARGWIRSGPDQ